MTTKLNERYALPLLGRFCADFGAQLLVALTYPLGQRSQRYRAWINRHGWVGVMKTQALMTAAVRPIHLSEAQRKGPMLTMPLMRKGEKRDVPEWTWATLARPASNKNITLPAGDTFGLTKGGTIEVIGHDDRYGVLVRYTLPPTEREPAGTVCPSEALLWMPLREIAGWPAAGTVLPQMQRDARDRDAAVTRLLSD